MSATVRFYGCLDATLLNSGKWRCKDKSMRQLLNEFYPAEFSILIPDPIGDMAEKVAKEFGAKVIHKDVPPLADPEVLG